jgi:hypothetical protein
MHMAHAADRGGWSGLPASSARYFFAGGMTFQACSVDPGSVAASIRPSGTHKVISCPTLRSSGINPELAGFLTDWHGRTALFTYYSFAQVMTIGYSDVTPVHSPATTLSLFAALFGVFYTAVVVSQFVGLAHKPKG